MNRKVFISFLGTGNYKMCRYVSKGNKRSKVVEYVQEAILDLYCEEYKKDDIALIFLTEEAENMHWTKLVDAIGERDFKTIPIRNVPNGHSEEEVWKIFELVYSYLEPDDEIILDVTHSFRSLPMLQIVLLNYAKSLKHIKVKGIYYGAFDALGVPAHKIDERIPKPENRNAPLLDLTAFSTIQTWTYGAESFMQTGNAKLITKLSLENIKPLLIESNGNDTTASNIRSLMNSLRKIEIAINTNRGKIINQGTNVVNARKALIKLQNDDQVFAPIKPILKQIEKKLDNFDDKPHWEAAVEWCIHHGLVQQGITQLQEGIISYVASLNHLDVSDLKHREIVAQSLNILSQKMDESGWRSPAAENKKIVEDIIESKFVQAHNNNYQRLTECRNDINHGGYKKNALSSGDKFIQKLNEIYNEFKTIVELNQ